MARNVLYIVFDDLRPDISAYGRSIHTPAMQKLADSGLVFQRAYSQIAVCAPSRNSFATGRRPNSTRAWNFINHFRQASCETKNAQRHVGTTMPGGFNVTGSKYAVFNPRKATGGAAQCCEACSIADGCVGWSFNVTLVVREAAVHHESCVLFSSISATEPCPIDPKESTKACVSGARGGYEQWTPLPAHFRNHGYLVLGTGKYYHDGGGGRGGAPGDRAHPRGQGVPPLADRHLSWSDLPIQWPNQTAIMEQWGTIPFAYGNFEYPVPDDEPCKGEQGTPSTVYCPTSFAEDGTPPTPPKPGQQPLADFITYRDAVQKLRYAAAHRAKSGQPFFLVVGIKRPHLNWRMPQHYAALYPAPNVSLPKQRVLDQSIWAGAYSVFPMDAPTSAGGARTPDFVTSPYTAGTDYQLRELRRHYYAAVSWADRAAGEVLDELDATGLRNHTLVVLHSDHGWHLGEYAMWEKRSLWELGVRVPFIMRVPWLPTATRQRSRALVELVDIYPTLCDLMGLPPPDDTVPLDGLSLRPVVEAPADADKFKPYALSTFPRCEHVGMPIYGQRGASGGAGEDNSCLGIERTAFTYMGYSMRTDRYRYTEWVRWNGSALAPIWSARVATELYDHAGDDGPWTDPDAYENVNLAPTAEPALLASLAKDLHEAFRSA